MNIFLIKTERSYFWSGSLETLQRLVGGYIEPCAPAELRAQDIELLANENGMFEGLDINENLKPFFYLGNVVAVGVDGENFTGLTVAQRLFIIEWLEGLAEEVNE